jgi:hypothetical protein
LKKLYSFVVVFCFAKVTIKVTSYEVAGYEFLNRWT